MTWFKVDDGAWGHPKFERVSDKAIALWLMAGSWSCRYLTDGHVPSGKLSLLRGDADTASELVSAGLWKPAKDGFVFHDWSDMQETKSQVTKRQREDRDRKRSGKRGPKKGLSNQEISDRKTSGTPGGDPQFFRPEFRALSTPESRTGEERDGEGRRGESVRKQVVLTKDSSHSEKIEYISQLGLDGGDA